MAPIMDPQQLHPYLNAAASDAHDVSEIPMSRTHQYRKVMKPLLERKRRARINKCLDDLKDLMVYALQSEGESITKLEKADVLELTVKHLQKLKRQRMLQANPALDIDRYNAGFTACASEVSKCLATIPGVDVGLGTTLMSHLGSKVQSLKDQSSRLSAPLSVAVPTPMVVHPVPMAPPHKPSSPLSTSDGGYSSGRESVSPRSAEMPVNFVKSECERTRRESASSESSGVWRPF